MRLIYSVIGLAIVAGTVFLADGQLTIVMPDGVTSPIFFLIHQHLFVFFGAVALASVLPYFGSTFQLSNLAGSITLAVLLAVIACAPQMWGLFQDLSFLTVCVTDTEGEIAEHCPSLLQAAALVFALAFGSITATLIVPVSIITVTLHALVALAQSLVLSQRQTA